LSTFYFTQHLLGALLELRLLLRLELRLELLRLLV
jgi:hypothetical protein